MRSTVTRFATIALVGGTLLAGCGPTPAAATHPVYSVASDHWVTPSFGSPSGGIVIAMASWCKYCAWEAKWQEPTLIRWATQHHIRVSLVVISPYGGIGVPGPLNNSNAGVDHPKALAANHAVSLLAQTMNTYAQEFHLNPQRIFLDPKRDTVFSKKASYIPSFFFLNASGHIQKQLEDVQTAAKLESVAKSLGLGKS